MYIPTLNYVTLTKYISKHFQKEQQLMALGEEKNKSMGLVFLLPVSVIAPTGATWHRFLSLFPGEVRIGMPLTGTLKGGPLNLCLSLTSPLRIYV